MNIEERVSQLEAKLQDALTRIEALEGKKEPSSSEDSPLTEYEVIGFRGDKARVFVVMNKHYMVKSEAIKYLGISRNTGYGTSKTKGKFTQWEEQGKIHIKNFVGGGDYIPLEELQVVGKAIWSDG